MYRRGYLRDHSLVCNGTKRPAFPRRWLVNSGEMPFLGDDGPTGPRLQPPSASEDPQSESAKCAQPRQSAAAKKRSAWKIIPYRASHQPRGLYHRVLCPRSVQAGSSCGGQSGFTPMNAPGGSLTRQISSCHLCLESIS